MTTTASSRILENSSASRIFESSSAVTRVGARVSESESENIDMGSTPSASARLHSHSRSTMSFDGSNDNKGMDGEEHSIFFHGNKYVGKFTMKNGKPKGNGRITYESGDIYTGDFQFGKPHGFGKMAYEGGDSYEGMWHCGRARGVGMYTCVAGRMQHIRSITPAMA